MASINKRNYENSREFLERQKKFNKERGLREAENKLKQMSASKNSGPGRSY